MKRKELIKRLFKDEIENFIYEIYNSVDNLKRVRTYLTLTDNHHILYKLCDEGIYTEELIERLKKEGYKDINDTQKLIKNNH